MPPKINSASSRDTRFVKDMAFNFHPCAELKTNTPFNIAKFDSLASRFEIKQFLNSRTLAYHLERHAGKNSFNHTIQIPLQKIQNYLESEDINNEFKRIHVIQLLDGIANCTPGFEIRAAKVAASLSRPVNLEQCLQLVRDKIGEYAINQTLANSLNNRDVHQHNSFVNLGHVLFNLTPYSLNDPYGNANIQDSLYRSFISHFANLYGPLNIIKVLQEFLGEEVQAYYKYIGEKNDEEGYDHKVYIGIIEYFEQLLNDKATYPLSYKEALIRRGEVIIDLNWPAVMQRFALKFFNDGYFTLYDPLSREIYPQALETMVCFYRHGFNKLTPILKGQSQDKIERFFNVLNDFKENPLLMVLKYQPQGLLQFIQFTREFLGDKAKDKLKLWLTEKNRGSDIVLTVALKSKCPPGVLEGLIKEYYKLADKSIIRRHPSTINYLSIIDTEGNNLLKLALHYKNKKNVITLLETVMDLDKEIVKNWFIIKNNNDLNIMQLAIAKKLPYQDILFKTLVTLNLKDFYESIYEAEIIHIIAEYPFMKDFLADVRKIHSEKNHTSGLFLKKRFNYELFCKDLYKYPGDKLMFFIESFSQNLNFFSREYQNLPIVFHLLTREQKYYSNILQLISKLDNTLKFEILNRKTIGNNAFIAWLQSIESWIACSSTLHIQKDILNILETMPAEQVKALLYVPSTVSNMSLAANIVGTRSILIERLIVLLNKVNLDIEKVLPNYSDFVERVGRPAISMGIFVDIMRRSYAKNNNFLIQYAKKYPDNFEIFFISLLNHESDGSVIAHALNYPCPISGRTALHEVLLLHPKLISKVIKHIAKGKKENQALINECFFKEDIEGNNLFKKIWQDFFQVRNYKTFSLAYDKDPESGFQLLSYAQRAVFKEDKFQSLEPEEQIPEVWKMRRDSKQSRMMFLELIEPLFNIKEGITGLVRSNVFNLFSNVLKSNYVFTIKEFIENNVHILKIFTHEERTELQKIANSNTHLKNRFWSTVDFHDLFSKASEAEESAKLTV